MVRQRMPRDSQHHMLTARPSLCAPQSRLTQHTWLALITALWACATTASASDLELQEAAFASAVADAAPVAAPACSPRGSLFATKARCTLDVTANSRLPVCFTWSKVEPQGGVCGDGSPYKFFVNYSPTSDNLIVMFEPGGACWDFESCTGGERGAANPHGIPNDHMFKYEFLNLLRRAPDNPVADWNMVFVSYCTGDIHAGNKLATYPDPAGGPALTFHHAGLADTQKVIEYLQPLFPRVPQLLVTGCSAGGIGALQNYAAVRTSLPGAQCGYLLNDSGPAFHSDGPSKPVHTKIREAWNLDTYLERTATTLGIAAAQLQQDFGVINTALADRFPSDRLAFTAYRMDFNYSLYEYQRFYPDATGDDIHGLWWHDMQSLMQSYDSRPNLAYFVPYFRSDNCSHCVSIPPLGHDTQTVLTKPWLGSEIQAQNINLRQFTTRLLDDKRPLQSYVEAPVEGEGFTQEQSSKCLRTN